ncbi:hypothetical protein [Alkalibacillus haloalkaliphilus]|uniref:hypothetical protein n=1 Tax=Alkalibacillus haloalkaliphilus TaxID=94136 RepID=UPI00031AEE3F|nr:hypothetical protein [Alkalibacillus haloalkaliphilus]
MEVTDQLIVQKTKKLKRIYENYKISPNHLNINGEDFYVVYYRPKFSNKISALTVVSTKNDLTIDELEEAFEELTYLHNFINSIFEGKQKKDNNMEGFRAVQDFIIRVLSEVELTESDKRVYIQCLDAIKAVQKYQEKHDDIMSDSEKYLLNKANEGQKFYEADINELLGLLAEFDYAQFKQLRSILEASKLISFLSEQINETNSMKYLVNNSLLTYINELINLETKAKENLKQITHVKNIEYLSEAEHKEVFKELALSNQKEALPDLKKDLRLPILVDTR